MTAQDVARLTLRLGEHNMRTRGETKIFESPAARVVRHKGFTMQSLVLAREYLLKHAMS